MAEAPSQPADAAGTSPPEVAQPPPLPASPYKGLTPYGDQDADFFFGRERESQVIVANLLASRLTLLYGQSGVGKTSVLRAGVVHDLRREALQALTEGDAPEHVVVEFATWRDDPLAGLAGAIETSVRLVFGDRTPAAPESTSDLSELIRHWTDRLDAGLLIILDQFEEYLLYHGDEDGAGTFAVEFPKALADKSLRANFLVAIREDAIARLDAFKSRIPNLFGNYLRLEHLDRESARAAVLGPVEEYNRRSGTAAMLIEPALVDRVLHDVARGQVVVGQTGQGTLETTSTADARIETPYLQLVMSRLWTEESAAGSTEVRLATLERLGGADRIVRTHLDEAMSAWPPDRLEIAAAIFRYLVTPGGTKIALSAVDLAGFSGLPVGSIEPVLLQLADLGPRSDNGTNARILRSVEAPLGQDSRRFEIFHDVLAPAILDWRSRFEEGQRRVEAEELVKQESEARAATVRRRALRFGIVAIGVLALAVGGIVYQGQQAEVQAKLAAAARVAQSAAEQSQKQAEQSQKRSEAEAILQRALTELEGDPQASLNDALAASDIFASAGLPPSSNAETALRLALSRSHLRAVLDDHSNVVNTAAFSPDGSRFVTASTDGTAIIADATTGNPLAVLEGHEAEVTNARFDPTGSLIVTASLDGTARVWDGDTGDQRWILQHGGSGTNIVLARTDSVDAAGSYIATGAFTGDGRYLVTAAGSSAWIWDLGTGELVHELKDPAGGFVSTASFSPDGSLVLAGGSGGIVRIWDVQTGDIQGASMDNQTSFVSTATFSPDGKLIACGNQDGSVGLWSAESHESLDFRSDHLDYVVTVAFSSDGTHLLTAGHKNAAVVDVSSLAEEGGGDTTGKIVVDEESSYVDSAAFSPDGARVVTANYDGTARVADANGTELFALRGHDGIVWSAVFSPDGDRVVTASEDGTARMWDVDTGTEIRGHVRPVNTVQFSPDGTSVVTASWDETASIWDATTGAETARIIGQNRDFGLWPMRSAMYFPNGSRVITAQADGTVGLWDAGSGAPEDTCCLLEAGGLWGAYGAEVVPGRQDRVVVQYDDNSVHVWDIGGAADTDVHVFPGTVLGFALSPDGETIVTVARDEITVWHADWDTNTFDETRRWTSSLASSLDFSPDSRQLVWGGLDGVIRIWDVQTGKEVTEGGDRELRVGIGAATAAAFSGDGRWVLAGQADGKIRIWDVDSSHLLAELPVHAGSVSHIDTYVDGRIATASDDGSARVFTCDTCVGIDQVMELARAQAAIYDPKPND